MLEAEALRKEVISLPTAAMKRKLQVFYINARQQLIGLDEVSKLSKNIDLNKQSIYPQHPDLRELLVPSLMHSAAFLFWIC